MLEHEIGSFLIRFASIAAWIYFGSLLYKRLPTKWPKFAKLPISIIVPMIALTALTIALGIDAS